MKKYLIVEPLTKNIAPNIALLKWCRWCKINGHKYKFVKGHKEYEQEPLLDKETGEHLKTKKGKLRYQKVFKRYVEPGITPDVILVSCIFSYYAKNYEETISHYHKKYPNAEIIVGGMFPTINENWFKEKLPYVKVHKGMAPEIEKLVPVYSEDPENTHIVLYSSRGCVNKCGYCMVPKLEGYLDCMKSIKDVLKESLKEWKIINRKRRSEGKKDIHPTSVVLYDNNFTAHTHFDNIIDDLIEFGLPVDIHGLHVDKVTEHIARRFAELKWASQHEKGTAYMRFGFDFVGNRKHVKKAMEWIHKIENDKKNPMKIRAGFFCYLLFNWNDTPHDFWRRIVYAQEIVDEYGRTIFLFPQRFEPLNAFKRNEYISEYISKKYKGKYNEWTPELVRGVVKMYTWIHGFVSVTKSRNLFRWIGFSEDEFFDNAMKFATIKDFGKQFSKNQKTRKDKPVPPLEKMAGKWYLDELKEREKKRKKRKK